MSRLSLHKTGLVAGLILSLTLPFSAALARDNDNAEAAQKADEPAPIWVATSKGSQYKTPPNRNIITNYSSLSELIVMICNEAALGLRGLYEAAPVQVEAFPFLWEFNQQRPSVLGIALADQMAAMLNYHTRGWESHPVGSFSSQDQYDETDIDTAPTQWLQGTIQEIDGFLRIHISARNGKGTRRSYVINAEMSEPIYRALHSIPVKAPPNYLTKG